METKEQGVVPVREESNSSDQRAGTTLSHTVSKVFLEQEHFGHDGRL